MLVRENVVKPVLDVIEKRKTQALSTMGNYALEKFVESKFAREKANVIPLMIMTIVLRNIFDFLIFYRFRTSLWVINFIISVVVTVGTTMCTPLFYSIAETHKPEFLKFTNNAVDKLMGPNGFEYFIQMRTYVVLSISGVMILYLQFVPITSRDLQELIIHTLITSWLMDKWYQWRDSLYGTWMCADPKICVVDKAIPHHAAIISIKPPRSRIIMDEDKFNMLNSIASIPALRVSTAKPTRARKFTVTPSMANNNKCHINKQVINHLGSGSRQINIGKVQVINITESSVMKKRSSMRIVHDYCPPSSRPIAMTPGKPIRKKSAFDTFVDVVSRSAPL